MLVRTLCSLTIPALLCSTTTLAQFRPETTLGGYGELHYNEPDGGAPGELDFHRFVLFVSHGFTNEISFRSELELEHTRLEAGEEEGGELAIEQAYLDYRLTDAVGLRAGILLAPVGLINLYHEPPAFQGVERPNVDRVIIPTTWSEAGAGIFGSPLENVSYQLYLVAGLNAAGFSAEEGIRDGRQEAFKSNPTNPSFTGRVDYSPTLGLEIGGSFFAGSASAGNDSIGTAIVTLWSADVRYDLDDFSFRAVGALSSIGDAELINARFGGNVPDRIYGFYLEGAYNFLGVLAPASDQTVDLFVRFERYDTQATTTGFSPLGQFNRTDTVVGLTYKPTFNTAVKFDYTFFNNEGSNSVYPNTKQLNLGIGYYFF